MPSIKTYDHLELLSRALQPKRRDYCMKLFVYNPKSKDHNKVGVFEVSPKVDGYRVKREVGTVIFPDEIASSTRDMSGLALRDGGLAKWIYKNDLGMLRSDTGVVNSDGRVDYVISVNHKVEVYNPELVTSVIDIKDFCRRQGLVFEQH